MTPPGPAARHDGGTNARSPFTGSDVCAAAALPLIPGGRTVSFDQDVWDFRDVAGLAAYLDVRDTRLDFTTITDPRRRLVAKEYIYARLAPADPLVAVLPRAYRIPLTLRTCGKRLIEAASWMNWLTGQQIASLGQVTQDHCDRYLIERGRRKDASGTVIGTLDDASLRVPAAVIIELAGYGELFTADRYADHFTPWQGRTSSHVAGIRSGGENKTPPLGQQILQPLLAAAFYLTATLGSHVVALRQMIRQDRLAHQELRCWRSARATLDELHSVLGWHLDAGEPLPALGNAGIQARLAMGRPTTRCCTSVSPPWRTPPVPGSPAPPSRPRAGPPSSTPLARSASPGRGHAVPLPSPLPTARPLSRGPSRWTAGTRATWPASCTPPA